MSFSVAAESYNRFMGRYSVPLAREFADFAQVEPGHRALDVGCGPGALTGELVVRLGAEAVVAVDPSEPFVATIAERYPLVAVRRASAESLPFDEASFDVAMAQLVVHFMNDPVAGLAEMKRVTVPGGVVAACVWDHAGGGGPLAAFWETARDLDPGIDDESELAGTREGHLVEILNEAGLTEVVGGVLSVEVEYSDFDDWWEPFTFGVGPAGAYVTSLDASRLAELRERCRQRFPVMPFAVQARAWAARGLA